MKTKAELLRWFYSEANTSVRFVANVIHCHYGKPMRFLPGLYRLAQADRVGTGNTIDQVSIDGQIQPLVNLANY